MFLHKTIYLGGHLFHPMQQKCLATYNTKVAYGLHTIDLWKMPGENYIAKVAHLVQMPLYTEILKCYTGSHMI